MQAGNKPALEHGNDRAWRQHFHDSDAIKRPALLVTLRRPRIEIASNNEVRPLVETNEGAIRQSVEGRPVGDFLPGGIDTLGVQNLVHLGGGGATASAKNSRPDRGEAEGILATALEARAMSGRERRRLVEEK